jgi:predicted dehydrogenase
MSNTLRFGFVGAGAIFRARHLPALVRMPGVELVAVTNRTRASAEAVAHDFGIAEVAAEWERVVARPDLDAVWIGTWPYLHSTLAIAALESGKHVFCQARMAMDLADARAMLEASRRRPDLVAMVCPAPSRLPYEPWFRRLVAEERLGPISLVELVSRTAANLSLDRVNWRERVELSGKNVLMLGIYAETLNAWFGPYRSLSARMATPVPAKRAEGGSMVRIRVPQVVAVAGELERGPLVVEHHTGLASDTTTREETITLWGLGGTVRHRFWSEALELAEPGGAFETVEVSPELRAEWTVEHDFVEAVHAAREGRPWRVSPDFVEGAEYMRKVEAVHASAEAGRVVVLAEL